MRIVIDLQGAQTKSRFRGIGRYTLSFVKALIRNADQHEFILVLNGLFAHTIESIRDEFDGLLPTGNILVWETISPVCTMELGNAWRYQVAEVIREAFIESLQPDLVHITSFLEGYSDSAVTSIGQFDNDTPVSVSLYDLIPLTNPRQYLSPYPLFKHFYLGRVDQLKRASRLLAISKYCREEGVEYLEMDSKSVINVSSAAEPIFHCVEDYPGRERYFRENFSIDRPFVLYTGGADERKNLPRLIRAFSKLPDNILQSHQLVFAGKLLESEIQKLRRVAKSAHLGPENFVLTGFISDEDLVQLYSRCALYVFPSRHEGFGLPALEAMACGAPVIGSRASSLLEVIAHEEAFFDPFSQTGITQKLTQVLSNDSLRDKLIHSGREKARTFSWDNSAQLAITAFESIPRSPRPHRSDDEIISRLIKKLASIDPETTPNDLVLARIAYTIDQNVQSVMRHRFSLQEHPGHSDPVDH